MAVLRSRRVGSASRVGEGLGEAQQSRHGFPHTQAFHQPQALPDGVHPREHAGLVRRVPVADADMKSFLAGERTTFTLTGQQDYRIYAYASSIKMATPKSPAAKATASVAVRSRSWWATAKAAPSSDTKLAAAKAPTDV